MLSNNKLLFTHFRGDLTDPVLTRMDICHTNSDMNISVWDENPIHICMRETWILFLKYVLTCFFPVCYTILRMPKHVCSVYSLSLCLCYPCKKQQPELEQKCTVNFISDRIHSQNLIAFIHCKSAIVHSTFWYCINYIIPFPQWLSFQLSSAFNCN